LTDSDFDALIAIHPLVNKSVSSIRAQLKTLKSLAISEIKAEVPDFWGRLTDSFELPANTAEIDMDDYLSDYDYVKLMWTDEAMLEEWTEDEFVYEYPDGIDNTDKPTIYIPKGGHIIKFAPKNNVATTINVTYMSRTSDYTLDTVPDRWQYLVMYHVLSFYDSPEIPRYSSKFAKSLKAMKNMAKESEKSHIKLIMGSFYSTISNIQAVHRGR